MAQYATRTKVARERTADEIERTLKRYGATEFAYAWAEGKVMVGFKAHDRRIRFLLPIPDVTDKEFTHTPSGLRRSAKVTQDAHEAEVRRLWRALLLIIKAKLEAVASGVAEFEVEFLPYTMLPNGQTVAEFVVPQVAAAYEQGTMPQLLPGIAVKDE